MRSLVELGIFVARLGVGLTLVVAGVLKVGHADIFAAEIASFQILHSPWIAPTAILLPMVEIMSGAYLVVGLLTRVAACSAAIVLGAFALAISSAVMRGIHTQCGCFGPNDTSMTSWGEAARDAALAALALIIVVGAPGAWAIDERLRNREAKSRR